MTITINYFHIKLRHETWDSVFSTAYTDNMFNFFSDSYLKTVYSSFPLKRVLNAKKK
jgi:hypothetical protein